LLKKRIGMKKATEKPPQLLLIPCSCGTTFAVPEHYDQQGSQWGRYIVCPTCGKRHDPRNRLLHLGYHREGYWKVDGC
jgi:hypothetical protein